MTFPKTGGAEWAASQASPWATVNASMRRLDALASRAIVVDRDLTAAPGSCADGANYLVAATPGGGDPWVGQAGKLATAVGANASNGWLFQAVAVEGYRLYLQDEDLEVEYNGSGWIPATLSGLPWKAPCRLKTTANHALSGLSVIDGVTPVAGDRILVASNSTGSENGIYVAASGAWSRASDADLGTELVSAAVIVSEGTAGADTMWQCTTNAPITVGSTALTWAQLVGGSGYSGGKQSIPIMAAAMTPRLTNGPATGSTESSTNKIMVASLDFDQSTAEYAQFLFPMPKSWNEGTITAQFIWACGVTGNVVWGIQGVALSDDDVIDAAFGTAQTVTDGVTATTDLMISAETSAVTIGGSPAEGDVVVFQVYRDAANGSDTAAGDAGLIGIRLFITTNAADDS